MFPLPHLISSASIKLPSHIEHLKKNASLILLSSIIAENDLIYSEIRWLIFFPLIEISQKSFVEMGKLSWFSLMNNSFHSKLNFFELFRNKWKLLKAISNGEKLLTEKKTLFRTEKDAIKNFGELSRNFCKTLPRILTNVCLLCIVNCLCQRPYFNRALK